LKDIASVSRHMTPELLKDEVKKIKENIDVYAYHLKPNFRNEIIKEVRGLKIKRIKVVNDGLKLNIS